MYEIIKTNLLQIQEEIAPCKPRIIAVTKYFDEEAMIEAYNEVATELAASLPSKWYDKLHTWRVFSMLSGPGTHVKNLSSNFIMKNALMKTKDFVGATIETSLGSFL